MYSLRCIQSMNALNYKQVQSELHPGYGQLGLYISTGFGLSRHGHLNLVTIYDAQGWDALD